MMLRNNGPLSPSEQQFVVIMVRILKLMESITLLIMILMVAKTKHARCMLDSKKVPPGCSFKII